MSEAKRSKRVEGSRCFIPRYTASRRSYDKPCSRATQIIQHFCIPHSPIHDYPSSFAVSLGGARVVNLKCRLGVCWGPETERGCQLRVAASHFSPCF